MIIKKNMHKPHDLFQVAGPEGKSEVSPSAREFSRMDAPEIMSISEEYMDYSFHFRPLFAINEPFPNLFENLEFARDASDLVIFYTDLKKPVVNVGKVKKMMKSNRALLKKIELVVAFLQSESEEQSLLHPKMPLNAFKQSFNKVPLPVSPLPAQEKCGKDKGLSAKLSKAGAMLIESLKYWTVCAACHKDIIDAMEGYKSLVSKYVSRCYSKESSIERLCSLLARAKRKVGLGPLEESESHVERLALKRKNTSPKEKLIWKLLNLHFTEIGWEVRQLLRKFNSSSHYTKVSVKFLDIASINRLSAIAKMFQYCLDNRITISDVINDRIYQKMGARFKLLKEANSQGTSKEVLHCPSLNEIPYLLSLDFGNIESLVAKLKNNVLDFRRAGASLVREEKLKAIAKTNKIIIKRVGKRMLSTEEGVMPQAEATQIVSRVRKRCKRGRKEEKQRLNDLGSDTNTTLKESSLKTTIKPPPAVGGPKFKILKSHDRT